MAPCTQGTVSLTPVHLMFPELGRCQTNYLFCSILRREQARFQMKRWSPDLRTSSTTPTYLLPPFPFEMCVIRTVRTGGGGDGVENGQPGDAVMFHLCTPTFLVIAITGTTRGEHHPPHLFFLFGASAITRKTADKERLLSGRTSSE